MATNQTKYFYFAVFVLSTVLANSLAKAIENPPLVSTIEEIQSGNNPIIPSFPSPVYPADPDDVCHKFPPTVPEKKVDIPPCAIDPWECNPGTKSIPDKKDVIPPCTTKETRMLVDIKDDGDCNNCGNDCDPQKCGCPPGQCVDLDGICSNC